MISCGDSNQAVASMHWAWILELKCNNRKLGRSGIVSPSQQRQPRGCNCTCWALCRSASMYVCVCGWTMQAMTNLFVRSGNKPWADYDIEACREVMASKVESGRAAARRMRRLT